MNRRCTPTVQAEELSESIQDLSSEELLALAEKRRLQLEVAGEIDTVADRQPEKPPARNYAESISSGHGSRSAGATGASPRLAHGRGNQRGPRIISVRSKP